MKTIEQVMVSLGQGSQTTAIAKFENVERQLTKTHREIIEASRRGTMIRDMDGEDCLALAKRLVELAFAKLGTKVQDKEEFKTLVQLIYGDLQDFLYLYDMEVLLALKSGLNGEFSKDGIVYFSSSNFVQWVKAWDTNNKREAVKEQKKLEEALERSKEVIIPDEAEQVGLLVEAAKSHIELAAKYETAEDLFQNPIMQVSGEYYYNWFDGRKVIQLSKERKLEIMVMCGNDVKAAKIYSYAEFVFKLAEMELTLKVVNGTEIEIE